MIVPALPETREQDYQEVPFAIPPRLERQPSEAMERALKTFEYTLGVIKSLDIDALGEVGSGEDSWPLRDELAHRLEQAIATVRPTLPETPIDENDLGVEIAKQNLIKFWSFKDTASTSDALAALDALIAAVSAASEQAKESK